MIIDAFMTGSFVYGRPKKDSDVDIVMLCDTQTDHKLWLLAKEINQGKGIKGSDESVVLGPINVISFTSKREFDAWKRAKKKCLLEKPISRKKAIAIHKEEIAKVCVLKCQRVKR